LILNRQKIVGWVLITVSVVYLAYFWRVRLMSAGAPLTGKDWFNVITCVALLMIGTINVRLAARRQQRLNDREGGNR
jgi:hypothetical protein